MHRGQPGRLGFQHAAQREVLSQAERPTRRMTSVIDIGSHVGAITLADSATWPCESTRMASRTVLRPASSISASSCSWDALADLPGASSIWPRISSIVESTSERRGACGV
jgi:hypothetical protein